MGIRSRQDKSWAVRSTQGGVTIMYKNTTCETLDTLNTIFRIPIQLSNMLYLNCIVVLVFKRYVLSSISGYILLKFSD